MTIQEEIREGLMSNLMDLVSEMGGVEAPPYTHTAKEILKYLDEKGGGIKVVDKMRPNPYRDTDFHLAVAFDEGKYSVFNATERLVEE